MNPSNVNIPAKLWKVAVVLEANQSILDINENNDIIAVILPNDASDLGSNDGKQWAKDGSQDGIGRVKLSQIEALTGFDLLSNIHAPVLKQQLRNKVYASPYLSSPLQADLDNNQLLSTTFIGFNTTITHNSSLVQSSTINSKIAYRIEQTGIFENSSTSVTPIDIGSFQIGSSEVSSIDNSVAKITLGQGSISEIGTNQIGTKQYSSSQINSSQIRFFGETDINEVSLPSSVSVEQLFNSDIGCKDKASQFMPLRGGSILVHQPSFPLTPVLDSPVMFSRIDGQPIHNNTSLLTNIYSTARSIWHTTTPIDLNFDSTNLPTGQLAEATITSYNPNGTPKTATITIDNDANGVGWFIDTTPRDSSEFQGVGEYFQATANSEAYGKYDLLTTILHEMGHTLGIINGYSEFDKYVKGRQFITDTFTANLTPDGSHLDTTFHPYDLMNTSLKPGVRKLPSALNLAMIDAINESVGGWVSGVGINPAHLTAGALVAINNGDFNTAADWNTLGATNITNGTATLTEQSQKLSELTQAFIIPTGAKTLQFTIKDNHLVGEYGSTGVGGNKAPGDAFEVALLDSNTFNPLAGTIGLTHSDSLLNIQANGTIHKSDKVTITALGNNSSIVTIDLTQIAPSTQATLYFNLLGFGARTSTVTYALRRRLRQRRRKTLYRHPTHPRHQKRHPRHQPKHPPHPRSHPINNQRHQRQPDPNHQPTHPRHPHPNPRRQTHLPTRFHLHRERQLHLPRFRHRRTNLQSRHRQHHH